MLLKEDKFFKSGKYQITVQANGGTASIEQSVDDLDFQQIPDASWSADAAVQADIADGILRPVLSGGALISVSKIRDNAN